MKIENQVSSPELSKKLEELGIPQDTYFMWVKYKMWDKPKIWPSDLVSDFKTTCLSGKREYAYAAFTCAELGEMLPDKIPSDLCINSFELKIDKFKNEWRIYYIAYENRDFNNNDLCPTILAKTEANARAKMRIYLIKEKLITL